MGRREAARRGRAEAGGSQRTTAADRVDPPADADPRELAPSVRAELRSLGGPGAERVARHLVAAGELLESDPEAALAQARAARGIGARFGVVREAVGIAAYRAGEWAEALAELRAARRITGDLTHLPIVADCERALGRPERAITLARSAEAAALPPELLAELRIVESGARRDLGQPAAALAALAGPDLDRRQVRPWSARLWYAYADALVDAGRDDEARAWLVAAASADADGSTDAAERLLELDGITLIADDDDGAADLDADGADLDADHADGTGLDDHGADGGVEADGLDGEQPDTADEVQRPGATSPGSAGG